MIECTSEYIYYKTFKRKNRRFIKRRKRFFFWFVFLIIISLSLWYANGSVYRLITDICQDYSRAAALSAVNDAVLSSLTDEIKYTDLMSIERNKDGDISLMAQNALKINGISRSVADEVKQNLSEVLVKGIPIPLMAFSGLKFASGYGPIINYSAIRVASVNCEFVSKFNSVGINQTLHSLYIRAICMVDTEFLFRKKSCECYSDILVSEAVLVGKVPQIYLEGALFG